MSRVRPAHAGAAEVFHDPFPSLVIQDEGHLLDKVWNLFRPIRDDARTNPSSIGVWNSSRAPLQPGHRARGGRDWPRLSPPRPPSLIQIVSFEFCHQREPLRFPAQGRTLSFVLRSATRAAPPGASRPCRDPTRENSAGVFGAAYASLRVCHDQRSITYDDDVGRRVRLSPHDDAPVARRGRGRPPCRCH